MRSIDVAANIIATADFDDKTERQSENIAAVTAAVTAAAAAASDVDNNDSVIALDAAATVAILSWKCPTKINEAFKNV